MINWQNVSATLKRIYTIYEFRDSGFYRENKRFSRGSPIYAVNLALTFYYGVEIRTCFQVKRIFKCSRIPPCTRDSHEIFVGLHPQFQSPSRRKKEAYVGLRRMRGMAMFEKKREATTGERES